MKRLILIGALLLARHAAAQEIPIAQAKFVGPGGDLATFSQTTSVTQVAVGLNGTNISFDKKDGPNRWPDNITPGWSGSLQYSIGLCENLNGWTCSAPIEVWYGRQDATGPIQNQDLTCAAGHGQIQCNFYYDNRWQPLNGHAPSPGEQLGVFVVAGDARNNYNPVKERSNLVLFNLPNPGETKVFNYSPVTPQPSPTPPTPPLPLPVPSVSCDLTPVLEQIAASRAENQAFYASVKSTWQSIGGPFIVKYIVPSLATGLTAWKLAK